MKDRPLAPKRRFPQLRRVLLRTAMRRSPHRWRGYAFIDGYGWVFPRENVHFVQVPEHLNLVDAIFNAWAPIVIEEGVQISHEVMFLTGFHEMEADGAGRAHLARGPITIERNAFLGGRAIILGGVTVGHGAVIGAGSVVTKSVPPLEFWAGNPARLIRRVPPEQSGIVGPGPQRAAYEASGASTAD